MGRSTAHEWLPDCGRCYCGHCGIDDNHPTANDPCPARRANQAKGEAEEHWIVKIRFFDGRMQKMVTLRAEDKTGLAFLQIASLKLQAAIMETIPVTRECEQR